MLRKFLLVCFSFVFALVCFGSNGDDETSVNPNPKFPKGLTLRCMPAIFWNTFLAEGEYQLPNKKIAMGLTTYYAWGINKNTIYTRDKSKDGGFGVDLFAKYYFSKKDKEGLFGQVNVSYNQIVYPEGTVRPFSINNNGKKSHTPADKPLIFDPEPFNFGFGVGYQIKMIPKHVFGSIMMGCQFSRNFDGKMLPTVFLLPSVSYVF